MAASVLQYAGTELIFFAIPVVIASPIDEDSPFYGHDEESWRSSGIEVL